MRALGVAFAFLVPWLVACGSDEGGSAVGTNGGGPPSGAAGSLNLNVDPDDVPPPQTLQTTLPTGFVAATGARSGGDAGQLKGGWRMVGPLGDLPPPSSESCANVLRVLMRDFSTFKHPDFGGPKDPQNALGLVEVALGMGRKPTRTTAYPQVAQKLDDWYATIPGVSTAYLVDFWLEPVGKSFVLDSSRFFPLDEVPSAEAKQNDDDGQPRNFGFTTELHTSFRYVGGEVFTFRGDDDVFVFVDGKLVVDIGGVHGPTQGTVNIDSLNLTLGQVLLARPLPSRAQPDGLQLPYRDHLEFRGLRRDRRRRAALRAGRGAWVGAPRAEN